PSPATAIITAEPVESEIDRADELKPSFAVVEYASVSTVSRGYSSPIPAPDSPHPTTTIHGAAPAALTYSTAETPTSMRITAIAVIRELPRTSPYRPCTAEAADHPSAESVRARPAMVGENSNRSMSRRGT